ncbi:unnamed protein product [Protopolystoma xenopodis]|uniref:Uncharacterized protein n=1 Tax=Protopolystoma xenopodis TaxID=117903 RepID=A0A3S5AQ37_9PLAT|nr:unnamed protein product [Protopolystoma xenopodis]
MVTSHSCEQLAELARLSSSNRTSQPTPRKSSEEATAGRKDQAEWCRDHLVMRSGEGDLRLSPQRFRTSSAWRSCSPNSALIASGLQGLCRGPGLLPASSSSGVSATASSIDEAEVELDGRLIKAVVTQDGRLLPVQSFGQNVRRTSVARPSVPGSRIPGPSIGSGSRETGCQKV